MTDKPNASGCYVVKMCINGTWQPVVVDDYLPVLPGTTQIAFAASKPLYNQTSLSYTRGALWVSLLEKAFAKLHGSYERIVLGSLDMGFIHLCGVPSVSFKHAEIKATPSLLEDLWQQLKEAQRNNYIMAAGTADSSKGLET